MKEIKELEKRFDKHLAIYAANGKESKRVADALEKLISHSEERDKKVDEMYSFFSEGKISVRIIKWTFALVMAIGGAALLFKNIIK